MGFCETIGIEFPDMLAPFAASADDTCGSKHAQMLGDSLTSQVEAVRQNRDGSGSVLRQTPEQQ